MPASDLASGYLALPVDARYRISRFVDATALLDAFGNEDLKTKLALVQTMSERFATTLLEEENHTPLPGADRDARELIGLLVEGLSLRSGAADLE